MGRRQERPLPPDEAVQLLLGNTDVTDGSRIEAAKLADELGNLRPALLLARAFMRRLRVEVPGYRAEMAKRAVDASASWPDEAGYPCSMAVAWQIAVDVATEEHAASRSLLWLLSFLVPAPLPRSVLETAPDGLGDGLIGAALNDAISALAGFALIEATPETIEVPEAVHSIACLRRNQAEEESYIATAIRMISRAMPQDPADPASRARMEGLLPHARAIADAAEARSLAPLAAARLLRDSALFLKSTGNLAESGILLLRAIEIGQPSLGENSPEIAGWLNSLAEIYLQIGRPDKAGPLLDRALTIMKQHGRHTEPHVAGWLGNLAEALRGCRRHDSAESIYVHIISLAEREKVTDDRTLDRWRQGLADVHKAKGEYAKAEAILTMLLEAAETSPEPDDAVIFGRLYNLAELHKANGAPEKVEPLAARARECLGRLNEAGNRIPDIMEALGHRDMAASLRHQAGLSAEKQRGSRRKPGAPRLASQPPPP